MDEHRNNEVEKAEEIMLPGFRFHPTDEELVGFYLKRKIQQRSLPIELIKQLDIYKYDPWDLPKLASTGEKEWYFYCPRDRKYRNSARPNRVTGAGFWKATGTDRPIYSSEGNKCIGLKKSLVFYRGRAAKGTKTDWMMHEFRLPSIPDKSTLANDSWAICRIFKKTNSSAQRALTQSWVASPPLQEPSQNHHHMSFGADNYPRIRNETRSPSSHLDYHPINSDPHLHSSSVSHEFSTLNHFQSFKLPSSNGDLTSNLFFSPLETLSPQGCVTDVSSVFEAADGFGGSQSELHFPINGFPFTSSSSQVMWEDSTTTSTTNGVPFGLPVGSGDSTWRLNNLLWDSSSFLPSEVSSSFSTNKCYI